MQGRAAKDYLAFIKGKARLYNSSDTQLLIVVVSLSFPEKVYAQVTHGVVIVPNKSVPCTYNFATDCADHKG